MWERFLDRFAPLLEDPAPHGSIASTASGLITEFALSSPDETQ
jgi:hypothetical protein